MARPRVLILRAPGTNCDEETQFAFEQAGASADRIHVNRLIEQPELATAYQVLCLPGGFSYGDDIAAGRILACQLQHHLADVLADFKAAEKLILGICNGFQVLLKTNLLLDDVNSSTPAATLTWNDSAKFEDRWVTLQASGEQCVFLRDVDRIYLPIAHAEGKFVACDETTLARLDRTGQLVLRYVHQDATDGEVSYPANPNGSQADVAGMCDQTGRVFGLMPHPERYIDRTQHPRWTRGNVPLVGEGMQVFNNAVTFFR